VLAHAFVVGGLAGGSERSIAVGGVESVSADVFAGFDYVALGHLHRSQVVDDRIRYSGSPLPYSFSESDHDKAVWLVDLDAAGEVSATRLALPTIRRLVSVRGRLAEVLDTDPDLADAYLSVELTDPVRPVDPMRRLRDAFPHTLVATWVGASPAAVSPGQRAPGPWPWPARPGARMSPAGPSSSAAGPAPGTAPGRRRPRRRCRPALRVCRRTTSRCPGAGHRRRGSR